MAQNIRASDYHIAPEQDIRTEASDQHIARRDVAELPALDTGGEWIFREQTGAQRERYWEAANLERV